MRFRKPGIGFAKEVITDPETQFVACWQNLWDVLDAAGRTFADVVDTTTYHVQMSTHRSVFREVKNRVFPRSTCAWTAISVSGLAGEDQVRGNEARPDSNVIALKASQRNFWG
ncbi:Rid family hydrolase [Paraburkholderia sediminicola]|uniref:Rid family hydrolase n=1 Tax=Paraburkholderia metrosideri TaxID=580937 RepID=A0ABW9DXD9_9BURK